MRGDADEALSILARAPGLRPNLPAIYHIVKARALALRQGSEDLTLAMTELESARAKKGLDKDDLTLTSEFAPLRARPEFDALLKSLDR
jgi:hypothetical protein